MFFPEVTVEATEDFLSEVRRAEPDRQPEVVEFGFSEEFMLPPRRFRGSDGDPLVAVAAAAGPEPDRRERVSEPAAAADCFWVYPRIVRHILSRCPKDSGT